MIHRPFFYPSSQSRWGMVFFHGYGGSATDIAFVAQLFIHHNPNLAFWTPQGTAIPHMPLGYQWFDLHHIPYDPEKGYSVKGISRLWNAAFTEAKRVADRLTNLCQHFDILPQNLFLAGFSQGAMLAWLLGCYLIPCAGVLSFSGAFIPRADQKVLYKPHGFVAHGRQDNVLPLAFFNHLTGFLEKNELSLETHIFENLGHAISERSIHLASHFVHTLQSRQSPCRTYDANNLF